MTSSSTLNPRTEFRDNCGAIVEERSASGRLLNRYKCGRLLGRGGFAKCFEFSNLETREVVACKIVEKASLAKPKAWQKLQSEIAIHKKMKHMHIVNFMSTFQDANYVYINLEICADQTLMELTKARRRFTLPETQYFMLQILSGVQYMHENNVIHRDLKLGNVMLHEMVAKIGDFGLAAELTYDGERKRTICGTPNYIAPEILEGSHSFEVDIWSLGVILYTMLVGKPPFETSDVKTTYSRIKQCRYSFPAELDVPDTAKLLVHRILQAQPTRRPTLAEIRGDAFFAVPIPPMMTPSSLLADSVVPRARGMSMSHEHHPHVHLQHGTANYHPHPAYEDYQKSMNTHRRLSERGREPLRCLAPNVHPIGGPVTSRIDQHPQQSSPSIPTLTNEMITTNVALSAPRSGSVPAAMRVSLSPNPAWPAPALSPSPSPKQERAVVSMGSTPTAGAAAAAAAVMMTKPTSSTSSNATTNAAGAAAMSSATPPTPHNGGIYPMHAGTSSGSDYQRVALMQAQPNSKPASTQPAVVADGNDDDEKQLTRLHDQLHKTLLGVAEEDYMGAGCDLHASREPTLWITEYADFSHKYGLAYRLSTGNTGVHYNDNTKMVWDHATGMVDYIARQKEVVYSTVVSQDVRSTFHMDYAPATLNKKVTLIKYFRTYLTRTTPPKEGGVDVVLCSNYLPQLQASATVSAPSEEDRGALAYVKRWMLTKEAMIFRLSNRTIQVCFFDKTEILLSSESKVVTYTNPYGHRMTLNLREAGMRDEVAPRLKYTKDVLFRLISK